MDVTQSGPDGYDYQYLASLYFFLYYLSDQEIISFSVDEPGTEDSKVVYRDARTSSIVAVEIQCKNKIARLQLAAFAEIISHFEKLSSSTNVLHKLLSGQIDFFHIIYAGYTADAVADLKICSDLEHVQNHSIKVKTSAVNLLLQALLQVYANKKSKLFKARALFNKQVVQQLKKDQTQLSKLFTKIHIADGITSNQIEGKIYERLGSAFNVRHSKREKCKVALLDVLKTNRGTKNNCLPAIKMILEKFRNSIVPVLDEYLDRGIENKLLDVLKTKKVLLLKGSRQCGKSKTAELLASRLVKDISADYCLATEMEHSERFFQKHTKDPKVCVLEDPLGQDMDAHAYHLIGRLEKLVQGIQEGEDHYLICTSSNKIVERADLMKGYEWQDLTVTNKAYLKQIWLQEIGRCSLPKPLVENVVALIDTTTEYNLLQPGELAYLAKNADQLIAINDDSIRHVATRTAIEIGSVIFDKGDREAEAFGVLGLGITILTGIDIEELSYVLDVDRNYFPGWIYNEKYKLTQFSFQTLAAPKLPSYEGIPLLDRSFSSIIQYLEDRGYLIERNEKYYFRHPLYQEAARTTFSKSSKIFFERVIAYSRKMIFSLNPVLATNCIKSLSILVHYSMPYPDRLEKVFTLVFGGFASTFVAVRDSCRLFLIKNLDLLSPIHKESIYESLVSGQSYHIYWDKDTPFYPVEEKALFSADTEAKFLSTENFDLLWTKSQDNEVLSAREAWLILNHLGTRTRGEKKRISYEPGSLNRFLNYNETFIREAAAYLIAASYREPNYGELKGMMNSDDTFIVFQFIKGGIRSYPYIESEQGKKEMLELLINSYDDPLVVRRSLPFMTQFSAGHTRDAFDWLYDIEEHCKGEMWYLWASLMPTLFKHLSGNYYTNEARFEATLQESIKRLEIANRVTILTSWTSWLKIQVASSQRSVFSAALYSYYIMIFKEIPVPIRIDVTNSLLSLNYPVPVIRLINGLVFYNVELVEIESLQLYRFLSSTNSFFQSIALITENVSSAIEKQITGYAQVAILPTDRFMALLGRERLIECLAILYLDNSFHLHLIDDPDKWFHHLPYFLDKPDDELFIVCVHKLIKDIIIKPSEALQIWPERKEIIRKLFTGNSLVEAILFELLLDETMIEGRNVKLSLIWKIFFDHISAERKMYFGQQVGNYIEAISYVEALSIFPKIVFKEFIAPHLYQDYRVTQILAIWQEAKSEENEHNERNNDFLFTALQINKIRCYTTIDKVAGFIRENKEKFSEEEQDKVNEVRNEIYDLSIEQQNTLTATVKSRFAFFERFTLLNL